MNSYIMFELLVGAVTCFALARSMSFNVASTNEAVRQPNTGCNSNASTSNTEDYLAIGTDQGMIEVHDLTSSQTVYRILGHTAAVTGIASIRSHELVTCGRDRALKLWDLRTK
jgi:WD40 repeat protein